MPTKTVVKHRFPNWNKLVVLMRELGGWNIVENKPKIKTFVRDNEKIIALNIGRNKWKAEYLINNRLEDAAGIMDNETVRIIIAEMAIVRGGGPFNF